MITPSEIEEEKEYLKKVLKILNQEIENYESKVKSLSNNIQEQMTYAWDKTNRLSDTEFVYALANIQKRSVYAENANKKVSSYKKMLNNTYFARIDFDDGEEILPVYIGITSLQSGEEYYVYDWRAPISSLFYNSEIGDASYTISTGEKVTGKLILKRQYKISDGEIKEVFDTDMQIIDSILKNILSANASAKMKNIVNTIQKEQNEIIRKNDVDILVINGPAGSGKTSIAMHKIAFLLYAERDKINNSNVMILSPNEIFNNYISDVLPEIGEDNVAQATFADFAKSYIPEFKIVSKIEDVYETIYSNKNQDDFDEIKFKYNPIYYKLIDDYIQTHMLEILEIDEIKIEDETIVSKEKVQKIANSVEKSNESLYLQGKKIIQKIFNFAGLTSKKVLTLDKMRKEALEDLTKLKLKVRTTFKNIYSNKSEFLNLLNFELKKNNLAEEFKDVNFSKIFDKTKILLENDKIEYQDSTAYMYLKSKLIGISANKNIKYVLIDETQDYTIPQYKILSMLFKNANVTLLGDLNQSILPFNTYKDYNEIITIFKTQIPNATYECAELHRTYRSTFEINEFAKKIITSKNNYDQIERHGDKVQVIHQKEFNAKQILDEAINLKNSFNTVAIICKNNQEILLYKYILDTFKESAKFRIVTKNDNIFLENKIMIIPSYLSKGLEFDAVLISNASSEYYKENERNLFYVTVTRALHKLKIFYTGKLTELLIGEGNEKVER